MATATTATQQPQVNAQGSLANRKAAHREKPLLDGFEPVQRESVLPNASEDNHSYGYASGPDDLGDWAPDSPAFPHLQESGLPHLPKAAGVHFLGKEKKTEKGETAKPLNVPLTPLQASISYSLARLLSLPRFVAFLSTPLGYAQFHAFLSSKAPASAEVAQLELWKDVKVLAQLVKQSGLAAKGINEVYLEKDAPAHVELPREELKSLIGALKTATAGAPGLDAPSKHLLYELYAAEFENFVRYRLLKHTKAQLSRYHLPVEDRGGIGSAFVLTNPRLPDDPIVLVSPGFVELTGYTAPQIIGRNCRFLQGKATSPGSVDSIRKRLEIGQEITQVVLNYRVDGTPFVNLVNIIPLRDLSGSLTYFIGGQTDITRAMTTGSDLSFILPEDEALAVDMSAFSPAVQVEAREAQLSTSGSPGAGPDLKIREVPATPPNDPASTSAQPASTGDAATNGKKAKEKDVGVKQILAFKRAATVFLKGRKKKTAEGEGEGGEAGQVDHQRLVPSSMAVTSTMPLEARMLDVQHTYEKLLVVRRQGRSILFCTSGFLRFVGLPGTSRAEVERSPLIHRDLLDLVVAAEAPSPTSIPSKELKNKVRTAIADAMPLSVPCGVRAIEGGGKGPDLSLSLTSVTTPVVSGRIHVAPLLDLYGESSAVTVV
ncbi:hypothetical protein JCM8097_000959 [Rhodosporidiobolus ruineniae]